MATEIRITRNSIEVLRVPVDLETDTAAAVKATIEQRLGYPVRIQQLALRGIPLFDIFTLRGSGLTAHDTLELTLPGEEKLLIVQLPDGTTITVSVGHHYTVRQLKENLRDVSGHPVERQQIVCDGAVLLDWQTLFETIEHHPVVTMELRPLMNVFLHFPDQSVRRMEVDRACHVSQLMTLIERDVGIPRVQLVLSHEGRELNIGRTLNVCGVLPDATITVSLRHPGVEVFIKTLTGGTIILHVDRNDTVAMVKEKIERQEGIPVHTQRLIFLGEQLSDHVRFLDYRIEYESAVHLVCRPADSFQIYVELPARGTAVMEVRSSDTVMSLKMDIQMRQYIPLDVQRLFFHNRMLEDEATLGSCGIVASSVVQLRVQEQESIQIFVSTPLESLSLWVNMEDTVAKVKDMIAVREGIPVDSQNLTFAGEKLLDQHTLAFYRIEENHRLRLAIQDPPPVKLKIRTQDSRTIELLVPSNEKVGELKVRMRALVGVEETHQELYLNGTALEDSNKLWDVPVHDNSIIDLIVTAKLGSDASKGLVLFVKSLTGKVIPIHIQATDTIGGVKQLIEDQEGISHTLQCLVCGGRELEDKYTIGDSGVQNLSTLHLVVRVPKNLRLRVRLEDGREVTVVIHQGETVRGLLKALSAQVEAIVVEGFKVFLGDKELGVDDLLSSYQIKDNSMLDLHANHSDSATNL